MSYKSRMLTHGERVYETVYSWVFAHDPNFAGDDYPRGGWFGFECDKDGKVDRAMLNPCARDNFDYCCLMRPWGHMAEREVSYWQDGTMQCDCGKVLTGNGPGRDYHCKCGRDYNSGGSLLAPREQWGEETGENAEDYDRGVANPEAAFRE